MTTDGRVKALKNAFLTTTASYAEYALGLVSSVVIARALGPDRFGNYAYVIWLCGWIVTASNSPFNATGIKFVAEYAGSGQSEMASRVAGLVWRWHRLGTLLVCGCVAIFALIAQPVAWKGNLVVMIIVVAIAAFTKARFLVATGFAKAHGRFDLEPVANIAVGVGNMALVLILASVAPALVPMAAAFALASFALRSIMGLQLRRAGIVVLREPPPETVIRRITSYIGWTLLLAAVEVLLSSNAISMFLLNSTRSAREVGFLAIALTMTRGATDVLTRGLNNLLLPQMARAAGSGRPDQLATIFVDATRYYFCLGLVVAGGGALLAEQVVKVVYGAGYQDAALTARMLMIVAGLFLVNAAIGANLSASDQQRNRAGLAVSTAASNVVGAFLLVPRWGVPGAIAVTCISSAWYGIAGFSVIRTTLGVVMPWGQLLRLAAAAVVTAGTGCFIEIVCPNLMGCAIALLVFAVGFPALSIVFRAWAARDYLLATAVSERLPVIRKYGVAAKISRWGGRWAADLR